MIALCCSNMLVHQCNQVQNPCAVHQPPCTLRTYSSTHMLLITTRLLTTRVAFQQPHQTQDRKHLGGNPAAA